MKNGGKHKTLKLFMILLLTGYNSCKFLQFLSIRLTSTKTQTFSEHLKSFIGIMYPRGRCVLRQKVTQPTNKTSCQVRSGLDAVTQLCLHGPAPLVSQEAGCKWVTEDYLLQDLSKVLRMQAYSTLTLPSWLQHNKNEALLTPVKTGLALAYNFDSWDSRLINWYVISVSNIDTSTTLIYQQHKGTPENGKETLR